MAAEAEPTPVQLPLAPVVECLECARKTRAIDGLLVDLQNAETDLRVMRRKVKALESELSKQRREAPEHEQAKALYELWKFGCRPRAREFNGAREKAVLARLRTGAYTMEDCSTAIVGAAAYPYKRNNPACDELELIFRDAKNTESFIDRGRRAYMAITEAEYSLDGQQLSPTLYPWAWRWAHLGERAMQQGAQRFYDMHHEILLTEGPVKAG